MKLKIKKIRLNELQNFIKSETFSSFETIPITASRAKSYINNPHALPEDLVLYLGFIENELVAFRSLFADVVYEQNETLRFAWCSGNWVHPGFRRLGFSEQLLNEAFTDWNGKLMFTNYAPASEQLYLKTTWFRSVHKFKGVRAYMAPKTQKLLLTKNSNLLAKIFFSAVDFVILLLSRLMLTFYREKKKSIQFELLDFPDSACYETIHKKNNQILYRGEKELKWIFDFPWIQNENLLGKNYPFSYASKQFYYKTVKVFRKNNFLGFFIFSVREGHLKTLYFVLQENEMHEIAGFLKSFCKKHKIEMLTLYNKTLAEQLLKRKFPFLHVKKYGQKLYSSFDITMLNSEVFQDGEGDVFFT